MKKYFLIFIILISFFTNSKIDANELIRFVDLDYIFINSQAGNKLNNQLKSLQKKDNTLILSLKEKLKSSEENLLNQKNVLSEDEYNKRFTDLKIEFEELNQLISKKNNNFSKIQNEAQSKFSNEISILLQEYSSNNNIGIILNKKKILIGNNSLDLTDIILEKFNDKMKTF
jgi:Skp family chaperone for outer membrane proteins